MPTDVTNQRGTLINLPPNVELPKDGLLFFYNIPDNTTESLGITTNQAVETSISYNNGLSFSRCTLPVSVAASTCKTPMIYLKAINANTQIVTTVKKTCAFTGSCVKVSGVTTNITQLKCQYAKSLIEFDVDTSNITTFDQMFYECSNITTISPINATRASSLVSMFEYCGKMISAPEIDTSRINNMDNMFAECTLLRNIPLYNTSNVTNMYGMFIWCTSLTDDNIPFFNTSNVSNMGSMFKVCTNLKGVGLPLFATSRVTDMGQMFDRCSSLVTIPSYNTPNVTSFSAMFSRCSSLTHIPNLNTSRAEWMDEMFMDCSSLTQKPNLVIPADCDTTDMYTGTRFG